MRKTKMELEQELRDARAVISRLENEARLAHAHVDDLRKERRRAQVAANSRGLIIKFLTETFFTSQSSIEE